MSKLTHIFNNGEEIVYSLVFKLFKEPLIKLQERSARDFVPN